MTFKTKMAYFIAISMKSCQYEVMSPPIISLQG